MLASIRKHLVTQKNNDEGASAVEYGLLVAAIAAIIILLVFALGGFVKDAFQTTCDAFDDNSTSTAVCP